MNLFKKALITTLSFAMMSSVSTQSFAKSQDCIEKFKHRAKNRTVSGGVSSGVFAVSMAALPATYGLSIIPAVITGPSAFYMFKTKRQSRKGHRLLKEAREYSITFDNKRTKENFPRLFAFHEKYFTDKETKQVKVLLPEVVEMLNYGNQSKYICETKDIKWVRWAMSAKMQEGVAVFKAMSDNYGQKKMMNDPEMKTGASKETKRILKAKKSDRQKEITEELVKFKHSGNFYHQSQMPNQTYMGQSNQNPFDQPSQQQYVDQQQPYQANQNLFY